MDSVLPVAEQTVENTESWSRKGKINYALAATLLAAGQSLGIVAPQVGAKNANVLKACLQRKGITMTMIRSLPKQVRSTAGLDPVVQVAAAMDIAGEASNLLKKRFSNILDKHMEKAEMLLPTANLSRIRQVGSAIEPFARIAKIVYDWGSDNKTSIVAVGVVQSILDSSTCGLNTPTGSVQVQASTVQGPQAEQVTEPEQGGS